MPALRLLAELSRSLTPTCIVYATAVLPVKPYTQIISAHGDNHLEQITTATRPPDGTASTKTLSAKTLFITIEPEAAAR
jgi:hypothetical protein